MKHVTLINNTKDSFTLEVVGDKTIFGFQPGDLIDFAWLKGKRPRTHGTILAVQRPMVRDEYELVQVSNDYDGNPLLLIDARGDWYDYVTDFDFAGVMVRPTQEAWRLRYNEGRALYEGPYWKHSKEERAFYLANSWLGKKDGKPASGASLS